jgi:hypothetical protein
MQLEGEDQIINQICACWRDNGTGTVHDDCESDTVKNLPCTKKCESKQQFNWFCASYNSKEHANEMVS